jgi:hypothetical protein
MDIIETMDMIKVKASTSHKSNRKFMIKEGETFKLAADTRDYDWVREIVVFNIKCVKWKQMKDLKEEEEEMKRNQIKKRHDEK